jgi:ATP-dependent DNA helicase RecG
MWPLAGEIMADTSPLHALIAAGESRSSLRNKLVAEGFYLINAIEKYGSGFIRIRRALKDYPEVQFDVQESQGGVMATFAQKQPESPDVGVNFGVNVGVNVGVNELLAYVQANPGQRAGDMAVTFAVTQRTIERWLKQLKDDQTIEFRGAPKTGGYYCKNT